MQAFWQSKRIQRSAGFALVFIFFLVVLMRSRDSWPSVPQQISNYTPYGHKDTEAPTPVGPVDEPLYDVNQPEYDPKHMPAKPSAAPAAAGAKPVAAGVVPALDPKRVALIIETRPEQVLAPLLAHMIATVPPQWVVKMVGTKDSFGPVLKSRALKQHIKSTKLQLVDLPDHYPMTDQEKVSQTLTNITFYRDFLAPAEWLLVFQTDSIICANSEQSLDDWVAKGYSWVGAPWNMDVPGGNGGLSLRHVPSIVEVLKKHTREENYRQWEDTWLAEMLVETAAPPIEEIHFSVESIYTEYPLGYHLRGSGKLMDGGVWSNGTRRRQIFEYCPEVKMLLGNMQRQASDDAKRLLEEKRLDENVWRKAQGLPLIPEGMTAVPEPTAASNATSAAAPTATGLSLQEQAHANAQAEASKWIEAAQATDAPDTPEELARLVEAKKLAEVAQGGAPVDAASVAVSVEGSMTAMVVPVPSSIPGVGSPDVPVGNVNQVAAGLEGVPETAGQ